MDIIKLFTKACKLKNITEYKLDFVKKDTHDFYFEDANSIFFVKVIFNLANQEICVNNAIKWQLRRSSVQNAMNFVENIEPLMRLDLQSNPKKQYKLFIIYPGARALLKVINECEMVFINPDTDVYGAKIITYQMLEENPLLLDV